MAKPPEGIKRITFIASILSIVAWISYVATVSNLFAHIKPIGWLITVVVSLIAYFTPPLICKIVYWVIDGFNTDKIKKQK